ncbi:MAG: penicillin-binding protein 2 [Patescibacteria group bacterium]|nr:penicillin-binding protein 2 [Patescibacteria group bacterium]
MNKLKRKRFFQGDFSTPSEASVDPFVIKEGDFKFGQLKDNSYYTDWIEHSFLSGNQQKEIVGRTFSLKRLLPIKIFIAVFILVLASRTAWLQVARGAHYSGLAEGNRLRIENIEPKRGIIYDANNTPLVRNTANFVLSLRPIDLPSNELERDELLRYLSRVMDGLPEVSANSSDAALNLVVDGPSFKLMKDALSKVKLRSLEAYQPLFIRDSIDYDKAMRLLLERNVLPGVIIETKIKREYAYTATPLDGSSADLSSLAHILGYTGKITEEALQRLGPQYSLIDYVGKTGLEYSWENELKGLNGSRNIEVDALGRRKQIVSEEDPVAGYNLRLSIDIDLQRQAEIITKDWLVKTNTARASVIVMNPSNGQIISLISLPAYDNNLFAQGISQNDYDKFLNDENHPLFNRSISGEIPSGSTIKPVIAAAALQEGVITENTSFLSTGGLSIGQWFFPDWKAGGHGATNVRKALAESVNTFFYYIGGGYKDFIGLGLDRLVKYMHLFGLGEKSGIDLPGESSGFVPTKEWKEETKDETWYIGDTYHISIGQGDILTTPLQVANFTATVANGGTLYRPTVVSALLDEHNNLARAISPSIIRQDFVDSYNLQVVREGMRQTVTSGSARSLSILPVTSAGKTGTAQWSSKKANHAWFTGFAPYENPEIVVTVLVEEGVEGSAVAVPIAKEIMQWYFANR